MKQIFSRLVFITMVTGILHSCFNESPKAEIARPLATEEQFHHFLDSLKNANLGDDVIINEIRRYVSRQVDLGNSQDSLAYNYYKIPWDNLSPFQCFELFNENRLTALCGFTSYILARLYHYSGYESYIYSCGFDHEMARHEFVLVKLDDRLVVQDAFFNITIADTIGQPKDFIRLLAEIKGGDFHNVRIAKESTISEFWLDSKSEMDSLFSIPELSALFQRQLKEVSYRNGRVRILVDRNYDAFTLAGFETMKPFLREEKLSDNYLSIYLKPLHVKRGDNGEVADSLKKLILSVTPI